MHMQRCIRSAINACKETRPRCEHYSAAFNRGTRQSMLHQAVRHACSSSLQV